MSDPERLLAEGASDFERELLGAWGRRGPSSEARGKVLAMAGIGVGAAALTTAGAAKAAGTSIAPKAVALSSSLAFKWMVIGALGTVVATGSAVYALRAASPEKAPAASVPAGAADPSRAGSDGRPAAATAPDVPTIELGPDTAKPARQASHAASPAASPSSTLDDQVSVIDQARRAVAANDPARALQLVSAYDARYPSGSLSQESTEIRIEALMQQGNRAAAERLATRFVAAHPGSPYVKNIRALLADPKSVP